jgi:hypothetical protein
MHRRALTLHLTWKRDRASSDHECFRPSRVSDPRGEHAARQMIAVGRLPVPGSANSPGSGKLPKLGQSQSKVGSRILAPSPPASPATPGTTARSVAPPRLSTPTRTAVEQEQQSGGAVESRALVANPPTAPRSHGQKSPTRSWSIMIDCHDGKIVCDGEVVEQRSTFPINVGTRLLRPKVDEADATDAYVAVLSF